MADADQNVSGTENNDEINKRYAQYRSELSSILEEFKVTRKSFGGKKT